MPAEVIIHTTFGEIATLLALAAGIGMLGAALRQPLIVSFIAVGLIAGPSGLDVVHSDAQIDLLAELGIAMLLFLVGIKLDTKLMRSLGPVALLTGLGQVIFTLGLGYLIGLGLEPSRQFKTILDAVYEMQLDGKVATLDQAIGEARNILAKV